MVKKKGCFLMKSPLPAYLILMIVICISNLWFYSQRYDPLQLAAAVCAAIAAVGCAVRIHLEKSSD